MLCGGRDTTDNMVFEDNYLRLQKWWSEEIYSHRSNTGCPANNGDNLEVYLLRKHNCKYTITRWEKIFCFLSVSLSVSLIFLRTWRVGGDKWLVKRQHGNNHLWGHLIQKLEISLRMSVCHVCSALQLKHSGVREIFSHLKNIIYRFVVTAIRRKIVM